MTEPLNWDEFRIVRAIAEAQSLSGAAELLGLNHSTLFRRLAAMEARLGQRLFDRERTGYRPTAAGEDMVALATLMGDTIAEFERRVSHNDLKLSGRVRVTTLTSLGALIMPPICAALAVAHPRLHVELTLTESVLDLDRGEADVGLRGLREPPPEYLTSKRVAPLPWAIYAVPTLMTAQGVPAPDAPWIASTESFGPPQARRWFDRHVESWRRSATASNDLLMAELAVRGLGVALLPRYVGVARPALRRAVSPDPEIGGDLWLVAHERALRTPRIRAIYDFLAGELERRRAWFEGEAVVGE
jgi:DNA-binding transcriptional LysR family regulator